MKERIRNIRRKLYEKAINVGMSDFVFGFAFGIIALYLPLIIHEMGHVFVASLIGYNATIGALLMFEGWTSLSGVMVDPRHSAVIALAGPLTAFFFGDFMWNFGKKSPERYIGLVAWLISTLPNLLPIADGRDATYIINAWGYPLAWFIFAVVFAYVWVKILYEGIGPLDWVD